MNDTNHSLDQEKAYWVAVAETPGIGPKKFFHLLSQFGSAEAVWKAREAELAEHKLSTHTITLLLRRRSQVDPNLHMTALAKMGVSVVTKQEEPYPDLLKVIGSAPPVLFVRGGFSPADAKAIAVVGTRKPTGYGREVTLKLVTELVGYGFTIVSGLARGIDGVAHRAAIEAGGRTIGFLGGGIDNIYPAEHIALAGDIMIHGALVSEFPPGFRPDRGNFPARNRLISGMCVGVLVVEGLSASGTIHTANHAKAQGRPVFAVPGQITSPMSDAPMDLLSDGAVMVRSGQDIVDYLVEHELMVPGNLDQTALSGLSPKLWKFANDMEELIYLLLETGPIESDEIIRRSTMPSSQILMTLSLMELKGMIKKVDGEYEIVR